MKEDADDRTKWRRMISVADPLCWEGLKEVMISDRLKRISLLSRLTLASIWGAGKGAFAPHRCWVYFTKFTYCLSFFMMNGYKAVKMFLRNVKYIEALKLLAVSFLRLVLSSVPTPTI